MLKQFTEHINTNFSFLREKRLLLACSGGIDSVVLAHLTVGYGLKVTLAHCNFNLRGKESDGDEAFVRNLSNQLKIPFLVNSFDTEQYVKEYKVSVQMAARELRYKWFDEILGTERFDYVLTAHHADDNLETFIINLSRGTGIDGLLGIPAQNGSVVRPLLHFSRNDILNYAKKENIKWREDSSNAENRYLRNKIRLEVVPKLKELHPTFLENFRKTQNHLSQTDALLKNHIGEIKNELFHKTGDHYKININELLKLQPIDAYLYQLLHEFGFTEWDNVKTLLTGNSGKEVRSKTHKLLKDRTHLILREREDQKNEVFDISENATSIDFPVQLKFEEVNAMIGASRNVVFLDKEKLNYPLLLRNWEKGDYFYPFGMKGKKKISKFFKDEKVDMYSKSKQWLLCSGDAIIWVLGKRMDERFKVDASTNSILKITLLT
ncbi:tRNA lysidine(34) synthetase TilS [Flagellimonas sp. HMM57]|uniref:tRNA lysidine(34) synthetase TilS n=1 Tax=unclassified Flagellimonas TaxID=2644544 RepID=UPI0013D61462|nr:MULTISPECIES: tRNA lysidine(34) synthetase TilS [unclassified Flagellimonas]UII75676.1 tRNA lysidine(34) synthetase TilS [Flagellimonas sp. HMM57]